MPEACSGITRRSLLAALPGGRAPDAGWNVAEPATRRARDEVNQRTDGPHDLIPLPKESLLAGLIQSRVHGVDLKNPAPHRRANPAHMLQLTGRARHSGRIPTKDLLMFHGFAVTGHTDTGDRVDTLRVASEVPGGKTGAICARARQHGRIVSGSHVRDKDRPGHVLPVTTTIVPGGPILNKGWKARNISGVLGPGFDRPASTIHDNPDRSVEMHGGDAVVPAIRTGIGHCTTTSPRSGPGLVRAAALKGCGVLLRTATGGFSGLTVQAAARCNRICGCIINNLLSPGSPGSLDREEGAGRHRLRTPGPVPGQGRRR